MEKHTRTPILAFLVVICTFFYCCSSFAEPPVYYYNGRVNSIDSVSLQVDSKDYLLASKCVYRKQIKRNHAFFEDNASARDLRTGDSVSMRINGNVVDHIIIEEWKR